MINLNCETKGNIDDFRGDPGSIYLVRCPKECAK